MECGNQMNSRRGKDQNTFVHWMVESEGCWEYGKFYIRNFFVVSQNFLDLEVFLFRTECFARVVTWYNWKMYLGMANWRSSNFGSSESDQSFTVSILRVHVLSNFLLLLITFKTRLQYSKGFSFNNFPVENIYLLLFNSNKCNRSSSFMKKSTSNFELCFFL